MSEAQIELAFITYNRLDYTRLALESLLSDPNERFSLVIWDNASTDGTVEYLRNVSDSRISDIRFSKENVGQTKAVNTIWSRSKADLLGKCDNDCLVTPGWTRKLAQAHNDIAKLGVVACWHYFADDFNFDRAKHKIKQFGSHQILRHPWTCGTGLLIKRETYERFGPIEKNATTSYWLQMAVKGYINGFYYPLILQEHMDDPKSKHTHLKDEESYQKAKAVTYNINNHNQETLRDRWAWRDEVLKTLLDGPWQAKYYTGWRKALRRYNNKINVHLNSKPTVSSIKQITLSEKLTNNRLPQFRTRTAIVETQGRKAIYKYPFQNEARDFVMSLASKELNNANYVGKTFHILRGTVNDSHVVYPYLSAPSLIEMMARSLRANNVTEASRLLQVFVEKIKSLPCNKNKAEKFFKKVIRLKSPGGIQCLERGLIDLTGRNIFISENDWIVIDHEWSFDFPVPRVFIIFRSILEMSITLQPLIRKCTSESFPVQSFICSRRRRYFAPVGWIGHVKDPLVSLNDLLNWELGFERYVTGDISRNVRRVDPRHTLKTRFGFLEINSPMTSLSKYLGRIGSQASQF